MINSNAIICEYEDILLGKKQSLSTYFISGDATKKELVAITLMRYALVDMLGWDFETIKNNLSNEILKKLKLDGFVKYIRFPAELSPSADLFYIAYRLYPEKTYPKRELLLRMYLNVISGRQTKFPKSYFSGMDGMLAACLALQYVLDNKFPDASIEALYEFFASSEINVFLKKNKLFVPCCNLFDDALEYLHMTLPNSQQSDLFFNYYRFKHMKGEKIKSGLNRKKNNRHV